MSNTYVIGLIRNIVGVGVAYLLQLPLTGAVLAFLGVSSTTARERATAGLTAVLFLLYTSIVRALEAKWPALAVFLGTPGITAAYQVNSQGVTTGPAVDDDDWMGDTVDDGAIDVAFLVTLAQFIFYLTVALAAVVYIANHLHH